jgi:hypothetical protein
LAWEDSFEYLTTRTLDSEKGMQIVSLDFFDPRAIENLTRPQKNDSAFTRRERG